MAHQSGAYPRLPRTTPARRGRPRPGVRIARSVRDVAADAFARLARIDTGIRREEQPMISSATLDDLARRIGRAIEASPAKDMEKNVKALLQGGLSKLDVVPRAEFDVQAKVLARTREKLEALEKKVAELEARHAGS